MLSATLSGFTSSAWLNRNRHALESENVPSTTITLAREAKGEESLDDDPIRQHSPGVQPLRETGVTGRPTKGS